jgi:hypothetical protein
LAAGTPPAATLTIVEPKQRLLGRLLDTTP